MHLRENPSLQVFLGVHSEKADGMEMGDRMVNHVAAALPWDLCICPSGNHDEKKLALSFVSLSLSPHLPVKFAGIRVSTYILHLRHLLGPPRLPLLLPRMRASVFSNPPATLYAPIFNASCCAFLWVPLVKIEMRTCHSSSPQ